LEKSIINPDIEWQNKNRKTQIPNNNPEIQSKPKISTKPSKPKIGIQNMFFYLDFADICFSFVLYVVIILSAFNIYIILKSFWSAKPITAKTGHCGIQSSAERRERRRSAERSLL
jgi:hypothetical protein